MNKTLTNILSDIRFWIILFFVVRLIGITNPPLETAHNWRQTTVAMVARNFLEVDNNIFYPRLDVAGEKTGITGMEFPLLNYLIYIVSEVFGYQHWHGRLINLIISSFGLWYFFMIIRKYFNPKMAFNATLILLFSIWFSYSRKIMPDTFSMSFILASIYYGSNYLDSKATSFTSKNLLLFFLLSTLGMLTKLPSAYLLAIFVLFFFNYEVAQKRKIYFSIAASSGLVISLAWYFYWIPYLIETYSFSYFFMGNSFIEGAQEIVKNLTPTLENFYISALKYIGFIVFMVGIIYTIIKKEKILFAILLTSSLSFLIIVLKMGFNFPHHAYYIIPFVPVMALVTGYALDQIKYKKLSLILLVAIGIEGVLNQHHDFLMPTKNINLLNLENQLDKVSEKEDLILINSGSSTTPMYFAHRKGWSLFDVDISKKEYINSLQKNGLKFIVIIKNSGKSAVILDYPISIENENFCIYKL